MLINQLTDKAVDEIAEYIRGNSNKTVRDIVYHALNQAMLDAYERGYEKAEETHINLQA
jgi:hypothetical protein